MLAPPQARGNAIAGVGADAGLGANDHPDGDDSLALKTAASTSLAYVLPVLDAFNHRHKNQHSASHWWASFSLLRRRSHDLAAVLQRELEVSRVRAIGLSGSASSLSKKKKAVLVNRPGADSDGAATLVRARWISRQLIPRCYVTFSQLSADNQHAPLGLLLLAILAHVHAALSPLSPSAPTSPSSSSPSAISSSAPGASQRTKTMPPPVPFPSSSLATMSRIAEVEPAPSRADYSHMADRGIAISRDELLALRAAPNAQTPSTLPQPQSPIMATEPIHQTDSLKEDEEDEEDRPDAPPPIPLKQTKKTDSRNKDGGGSSYNETREPRDKERSEKKKKKKKHGDALSSLFGSLA